MLEEIYLPIQLTVLLILLGFIILLSSQKKEKSLNYLSYSIIILLIWQSIDLFSFILGTSSILIVKLNNSAGILTLLFIFFFTITFLKRKIKTPMVFLIIVWCSLVIADIILTGNVVRGVRSISWGFRSVPGPHYVIVPFTTIMLVLMTSSLLIYEKINDKKNKALTIMIIGVSVSLVLGILTEVVLPNLGIDVPPLANVASTILIATIIISIRYHGFKKVHISLAQKVILSTVMTALILVILLGSIVTFTSIKVINKQIEENFRNIGNIQEISFSSLIKSTKEDVMTFSRFISELSPDESEDVILAQIQKIIKNHDEYNEIFIMDSKGKITISTDASRIGMIKEEDPYFVNGKNKTFVKSFYYSLSRQEPSMVISTPFFSNNTIVGVFAARVNINKISSIMINNPDDKSTMETYLVNNFMTAVTGLKKVENAQLKKKIFTKGTKSCFSRTKKSFEFLGKYEDYAGNSVIGMNYLWPEYNMCLMIEVDSKEAFSNIQTLFINVLIASGITSFFLVIFITLFINSNLTHPIKKLHDFTGYIVNDDYSHKIVGLKDDEIGDLGRAFNRMVKKIEKNKVELEKIVSDRTDELTKKVLQLETFKKLTVDTEIYAEKNRKRILELEDKIKKIKRKKRK